MLRAFRPRFARLARRFVVAASVALAPIPVFATAPQLPGSEDLAFREAFSAWLANDEEHALGEFSRLAQAGNPAARIILGLIDKSPSLQGPYLAHLDRQDRLSVLREPGGLSGQNWLARVSDVPLVATFLAVWNVSMDLTTVHALETLDEPRAARQAMIILAGRQHPSLRALEPAETESELLYLLWRSATAERREMIRNLTPAGHPQRLLMGERIDAREIDTWLATSDIAAPITTLCQAVCPESGESCRGAAYRMLNSHNALLTLGTPTEALISQEAFLASPRGQSAVMRRIMLATDIRGRRAMVSYLQEHSSCLATALTEENQQYLPRIPGMAPAE